MRTVANEYAARGWRVLPVHWVREDGTCSCRRVDAHKDSKGVAKHPVLKGWTENASTSGADIEEWWTSMPDANIGIATGRASGIFVLDVDPAAGGASSLESLLEEHGDLPATYVVETPTGGSHYYFNYPTDFEIGNSASTLLGPGLDIRGDGGQVVAPPSRVPGGHYRVSFDGEVSDAPLWLLDKLRPKEKTAPAEPGPLPSSAIITKYVQATLDGEHNKVSALARDSGRNAALNSAAFVLGTLGAYDDSGLSRESAYMTLEAACIANKLIDDDGQKQFDDTFESGWSAGLKSPRSNWPPVKGEKPGVWIDFNRGGVLPDPATYFADKTTGLNMTMLSETVKSLGPLAWGINDGPWSYSDGVWSSTPEILVSRTVAALGPRYRMGYMGSVSDIVKHTVPQLSADPRPAWLNFRNTMVDWQTGATKTHDPDLLSTTQLGCDWDPAATCEQFDKFLASVLHPDLITVCWEMIGYLMYQGNPLQVAFMLLGSGQNGKGTLLRVVTELLGHSNVCAESLDSLNSNRFAAYSLFGKLANIAGDIDATYQDSTATFKKLTGEDVIGGEQKYGKRFTFASHAVPVFSANKTPGSSDTSLGYLRRWVILSFPVTVTNPVRGLSDQLSSELPGIAVKGISALRSLMARGSFLITGEAEAAKDEFAEAIDQVRQWISDACLASPEHFEPRSEMYKAYRRWSEQNGGKPMSASTFYHRLEAIGLSPHKTQGIRGFKGLMVSSLPAPAPGWEFSENS